MRQRRQRIEWAWSHWALPLWRQGLERWALGSVELGRSYGCGDDRGRRDGRRRSASGRSLLVNDVDDTICNKNIWQDDHGAVDKDGAIVDGDGDIAALHGLKGGCVHEHGAVTYHSADDCRWLEWLNSKGEVDKP